ncbi:hypothetical protein Pmani_025581 [Petrolisthes manimaculis]|uniref:Uncharacterized protein n=1 Tax=Petrolisthes manimaculis TaxID=1843537 RepID=A0AAE1TYS9_9EUCA|nr:hypothetical protein Pmani_025581 [Petrolisthes manimaculis]
MSDEAVCVKTYDHNFLCQEIVSRPSFTPSSTDDYRSIKKKTYERLPLTNAFPITGNRNGGGRVCHGGRPCPGAPCVRVPARGQGALMTACNPMPVNAGGRNALPCQILMHFTVS